MRLLRGVAVIGGTLVVLAATVAPAPVNAGRDRAAQPAPVAPPAPAEGCSGGPGWEMTANDLQENYTSHPFVGNGYLSQRVPPAGTALAEAPPPAQIPPTAATSFFPLPGAVDAPAGARPPVIFLRG